MAEHAFHLSHNNSRAAFHQLQDTLTGRAHEVYKIIANFGPMSDREVLKHTHYTDMNSVRPYITRLVQDKILFENGTIKCPVTYRTVRLVSIPRHLTGRQS